MLANEFDQKYSDILCDKLRYMNFSFEILAQRPQSMEDFLMFLDRMEYPQYFVYSKITLNDFETELYNKIIKKMIEAKIFLSKAIFSVNIMTPKLLATRNVKRYVNQIDLSNAD